MVFSLRKWVSIFFIFCMLIGIIILVLFSQQIKSKFINESKRRELTYQEIETLSLGIFGVSKAESLPEIKAAGYKSILYSRFPLDSDQRVKEFLDRANQMGLKVVVDGLSFWQSYGTDTGYHNFNFSKAEAKLKKYSNHPSVIGIYPYEEPSGNQESPKTLLPKLQRVYKFIKEVSPQLIVVTTEGDSKKFTLEYAPHIDTYLDFLLLDYYPYRDNTKDNQWINLPFGYNTVNLTAYKLSQLDRQLMLKIPWGGVLQAHEYPGYFVFPPKENIYNQANIYQSYGAKSLWTFSFTWGLQPKEKSPISKIAAWQWLKDINRKFDNGEDIRGFYPPLKANLLKNYKFQGSKYWQLEDHPDYFEFKNQELIIHGKGTGTVLDLWQELRLQVGQRYAIIGQFKSESLKQRDGVAGKIQFFDSKGHETGEEVLIPGRLKTPNFVWQRREFTPPPGTVKGRLTLFYNDIDNLYNKVYYRNLALGPI